MVIIVPTGRIRCIHARDDSLVTHRMCLRRGNAIVGWSEPGRAAASALGAALAAKARAWVGVATLVLAMPRVACSASKVDSQIIGTWALSVPGQGTWVLKFNANGTYQCTNEGTNLPGHSGTFEAADGKWKTQSTAGTPWSDGGPYQFIDSNHVTMTGKLGTAVWIRRTTGPPNSDKGKGSVSDTPGPPAGSALLSKIIPLVSQARELAKAWQKDAALVGIFVKADAEGRVDLKNLMSPTNQHGGAVTLQFYSAAARQVQPYGIDPSGRIVAQGPAMPPGTEIVPIPDSFLDLDEAVAKAREAGLRLPKADGKRFIDARITGVQGISGKPDSAIWKVSAFDMSGAYPIAIGQPIELAAGSGAQTTWEKESGHEERGLLAEELSRGKYLPYDPRRELSAYRKEADALAAKWNAGLKLTGDAALKLCEIEIDGKYVDRQLEIGSLEMFYFRPTNEAWSIFKVAAFGTTDEERNRQHVMLIRGEESSAVIPKASLHPQAVPQKYLSPAEAVAKLSELDPRWSSERIFLRLVFGGSRPAGVDEALDIGFELPVDLPEAARTKWLWGSYGKRAAGKQRAGIFTYNLGASVYFAIDAVTGEGLIWPDRDGEPPTGVDPALVGTWRAPTTDPAYPNIKGTVIFVIAADSEFVMRVEGDDGESEQMNARIAAANGKCAVTFPDGRVEIGTYRLDDSNTLTWTEGEAPLTMKRVSNNLQEKPFAIPKKNDPALVGVWQANVTDVKPSVRMTLSVSGSGQFIDTAETSTGAKQFTATIEVANGEFLLKSPTNAARTGTYRLIDAKTLTWSYEGERPVTFKRIADNP